MYKDPEKRRQQIERTSVIRGILNDKSVEWKLEVGGIQSGKGAKRDMQAKSMAKLIS